MLEMVHQPSMPLSNFMFSGRISLTIICKNQSVSINFGIAAVKAWASAGPFVYLRLPSFWFNQLMSTRGQDRQDKKAGIDRRHNATQTFSWTLMKKLRLNKEHNSSIQVYLSFHHITSHRSHYQHHTWPSIVSSTDHRLDIHTNNPRVHYSLESVSSMYTGLLMKTRGQRENLSPSSKDPRLMWRFPRNAFRFVCVCLSVSGCSEHRYI